MRGKQNDTSGSDPTKEGCLDEGEREGEPGASRGCLVRIPNTIDGVSKRVREEREVKIHTLFSRAAYLSSQRLNNNNIILLRVLSQSRGEVRD